MKETEISETLLSVRNTNPLYRRRGCQNSTKCTTVMKMNQSKRTVEKKILIITRETHPAKRVDLTILFSTYLVRSYKFDWVMRDELGGSTRVHQDNPRECTFIIGGKGFKRLLSTLIVYLKSLRRIFSDDYSLIQCRDTMFGSVLFVIAARLTKTPFTYWMSYPMDMSFRGHARVHFRRKKFLKAAVKEVMGIAGSFALYRITLPLTDHIFVQSKRMKRNITQKHIHPEKITPIPMGIDTNRFLPTTPPKKSIRQKVVYTGTLDPARQMQVPSTALAKICREQPNIDFVLIGKTSSAEREIVLAPFKKNDVTSQAIFLDYMPLEDMLEHVRSAKLCLAPCPSDTEMLAVGTPTKLVEYAAMGKHIVANSHPDQNEVAKGTGLVTLCDFSAEGFYEAIQEALLLKEPTDAEIQKASIWIDKERSYQGLSKIVKNIFEKILSS